jgi:hypothetical protein
MFSCLKTILRSYILLYFSIVVDIIATVLSLVVKPTIASKVLN